MGLITRAMSLVFGGGRNVLAETAEVFRVNAEAEAARAAGLQGEALRQFGREFAHPRRGLFDRIMDGVNRLPRPAMALGTLGLITAAMVNPVWFASRMQGLALVPEPLWWLLGAIVSFYFGARHQVKSQEFRRSIAETAAQAGVVTGHIRAIEALADGAGHDAPAAGRPEEPARREWPAGPSGNAALDEWKARRG